MRRIVKQAVLPESQYPEIYEMKKKAQWLLSKEQELDGLTIDK